MDSIKHYLYKELKDEISILSKQAFIGQMDLILVRYSVTSTDLPYDNLFCFEDNVVKVNNISESMCNAFAPIFIYLFIYFCCCCSLLWMQ
jgi:hypothetical protein